MKDKTKDLKGWLQELHKERLIIRKQIAGIRELLRLRGGASSSRTDFITGACKSFDGVFSTKDIKNKLSQLPESSWIPIAFVSHIICTMEKEGFLECVGKKKERGAPKEWRYKHDEKHRADS